MSEKTVHIVFQVLNFLHNLNELTSLNDAEKLLLITLASHKGVHGIYPSAKTLARELQKGESTIRRLIAQLIKKNLILVDYNLGKSSQYTIVNLSTTPLIGERGIDSDPSHRREDTPLTDERTTPLTGEKVITKLNNKVNNREGRTLRATPLTDEFRPDQKTRELVKSLSFTDEQRDDAMDKFFEYFLDSEEKKRDWQKTCRIWFRRERAYLDTKGKGGKLQAVAPTRQPDVYKKQEKEPAYTDPVKAKELMKGIMKSLKGQGGLTNGISPKVRGNGQSG